MTERDVKMLDQLHAVLGNQADLPSVIEGLAKHALAKERLRFPDYARLRPVDSNMHSTIGSF